MGSRPLAALIGSVDVVALSACGPATPSTKASPQAQGSTSSASSTTPAAQSNTTPTTVGRAGVYGDPAAAAKYWQQQSLEDNCGLVSVADVVGEITGHAPTEQQVIALAVNTPSGTNPGPIYAPVNDPSHANGTGGTEMADEVVLLEHYGVKSVMTDATTHPDQTGLPALERYLTENRKIIAWVNSAVIRNTSDQRTAADHFLVVTGIDTNAELVHLNDPGADHADERVSITTFTTAWQTGGDSIVVTVAA
ncbi:C39 family peptidase [Mycobacterium sp. 23]|uniref:C39 family peptidase n=1 Tax=Mycobacterium sp. 23 TaxID=3400424 RepID=UPI003AAD4772